MSLEQIDKLFTGEKVLLHWNPSMGEKGLKGAVGWDTEVKSGATNEHVEKPSA